jgi:hypothetical protein
VAHPQIAVFARLADGGAERLRAIEGQRTLLGRTMHAISYDPIHDEIVVPQQFGQAVLTFAGGARDDSPPKRVIRGSKTQLVALDRLGIDPVNNEIYVPEGDKVLVFPREANGDVAPVRVLQGAATRIGDASALGIDPIRNLLIVASSPPREPGSDRRDSAEVTIFDRTANGNVKPLRVITGVPGQRLVVYPERGLIFVLGPDYVGVWSVDDNGAVPPRYTIGGPKGPLRNTRGVTIDAKNRAVIVSDKDLNAVLTFEVPEIFAAPPAPPGRR